NVIPPDHVDDVPVVKPNQHDDVPEPVLVDEDEDPKEDEFKEEEDPQEEEDDTEVEKKGKAKDEYYGKLILDLGNEVRSSVEQGTTAMEKLVEKLSNTKDRVECKKLKKELEEARFSNTFLRICRMNESREISIGLEFDLMSSIK
ncbi:hypothetical protein Tco_0330161, partial [Tanacetum coccineum]